MGKRGPKSSKPENFKEWYSQQKQQGKFDREIAKELFIAEATLIIWKRQENFKPGDFRWKGKIPRNISKGSL
jgi:hypothetical protein